MSAGLNEARSIAWALADEIVRLDALIAIPGPVAAGAVKRCRVRIVGHLAAIEAAAPLLREALAEHTQEPA